MAPRIRHGHGIRGKGSRTYRSWQKAKTRCYSPQQRYFYMYGGAGITMCDEWRQDFAAFLRDMGERPPNTSLDRYPNQKGNYEPGNCRWATVLEQHNNKRTNRCYSYLGETHTLREWARLKGLSYGAMTKRFDRWTVEEALTIPLMPLSATRRGHRKYIGL